MLKASSLTAWLLAMASGSATAAVHFDPPDLNLEFQLHQNYLAAKGHVPNPVNGTSEYYRIQKGETLWSLSEMLYGDGQYWPRVWAQNRAITNPNLVRQGHTLQFILGSEDQTPAFRFSEDGDEGGIELAAGPGQNPIVEIPPPEVPPKPVLKIPRSFPEWQSVFKPTPEVFVDDRALGTTPAPFAGRMYLHSYVQETPLVPLGRILETDSEASLPVTNQYIYVTLDKGVGQPGMTLLLAHDEGPIKKLNSQWEEKVVAHLIQLRGQIQLTEEVPANFKKFQERETKQAWRALVTHTIGLPSKDSVVIDGKLELIEMTSKGGTPGTTNAQIIGSGNSAASSVFGPGDIVFLNKGASHGVEVGSLLSIFSDRTARHRDTPVRFSTARAGTLKVLRVSDRLSTAIVVEARQSVQQGDQVRESSARGSEFEKQEAAPERRLSPVEEDELDYSEPEFDEI